MVKTLIVNIYVNGENILRFVGVQGQKWDHVMKYMDGNTWVDQIAYEKVEALIKHKEEITRKIEEVYKK